MCRPIYLILVATFFLFISCGGGKPVKPELDPSIPGMKELQKGIGWYQKGCYHKSLENFIRAHELFTASDHLVGVAMILNNIGNVYRHIGDAESALLFFNESQAIYVHLKNHAGAIQALSNKAAVYIQNDQIDKAGQVIQTAETMAEDSGIVHVALMNNKGVLLTRKKDYASAEEILLRALAAIGPGKQNEAATVYSSLGNLKLKRERYREAIEYFEKAIAADRRSQYHMGLAENLNGIGRAYYDQDKFEPAVAYFKRSAKIYALIGNKKKTADTLQLLEDAAAKANLDIRLTKHFLNKWKEGDILEHPCQ